MSKGFLDLPCLGCFANILNINSQNPEPLYYMLECWLKISMKLPKNYYKFFELYEDFISFE